MSGLANTLWRLKDNLTPLADESATYNVVFVTAKTDTWLGVGAQIKFTYNNGTTVLAYVGDTQRSIATFTESATVYSATRDIDRYLFIESGTDVSNADLIEWLEENAEEASFAGMKLTLADDLDLSMLTDNAVFAQKFKSNHQKFEELSKDHAKLYYGATEVYNNGWIDDFESIEFLTYNNLVSGYDEYTDFLLTNAVSIEKGVSNMGFTKIPTDTMSTIQLNAGIMVDSFTPSTGEYGNIIGATNGGFTFNANPTFVDFGEDIDNCPANTWQLKRISAYDPTISGTFVTVDASLAKKLNGAGSVDAITTGSTIKKVTPSKSLVEADFADVWVIGDYTSGTGNFVAVHIKNALNQAGFQWSTTKDGKGQFAFEFHGHYDYEDIDDEPFEIYVKEAATT